MTAEVVTVAPQDTVEHAARLMYSRKVKRLPVVDGQRRLVGIISRADVLAVFDRTDEDIREEVSGEVSLFADPKTIGVTVKDGIVTLTGEPESNLLGHEMVQQVQHVQGVVAVRDRLSYLSD